VTLLRLKPLNSLIDGCHTGHHLDIELVFSLHGVSTLNSDLNSSWLDSSGTDGDALSVLSVSGSVVFEKQFNRLTREQLNVIRSCNATEVRGP
jgi:hypothetical protein